MTEEHDTVTVSVRVDRGLRDQFHRKAEAFGGVSALLREFIEAFLEDRLTIENPEKKGLYK